jgi:hypothetical protein
MAYMLCVGHCICCKRVFSFNPDRVPSTRAITGSKEPVCQLCMAMLNAKRQAAGLEPFPIMPGAYDAEEHP